MKMDEIPPDKVLGFGVIGPPLDDILIALKNSIDHDWPKQYDIPGAQVLFLTMIKVAINTYQSILFLAADSPKDSAAPLEFALSIPPLTRSLLDQLFAAIFLAEDLNTRTQWYYKAGWRESKESYDRYRTKYGDHPTWKDWFVNYGNFLEKTRVDWGISDDEAASLNEKKEKKKKIKHWPIPSKIQEAAIEAENRAFLQYLYAWFYRTLSQAAHLSFPGLVHRGSALLLKPGSAERKENLAKRKSIAVATTITIVLALASEMEHLLQYGLGERLAFVWRVLIEYWEEADDLYKMRYRQWLKKAGEEKKEKSQ